MQNPVRSQELSRVFTQAPEVVSEIGEPLYLYLYLYTSSPSLHSYYHLVRLVCYYYSVGYTQ
jgi:hypothetical protein